MFEAEPVVYGGAVVEAVEPRLGILVRTPREQWAYALAFRRRTDGNSGADPLIVRVRVEVLSGSIGVGCLDASQEAFLDEQLIGVERGPVDIELLTAAPDSTGPFIIRNASPDGESQARVGEIACYSVDLETDFDTPREPPLSEPHPRPRWSRFYGNEGLTLAERLRARHFEAIQGSRTLTWSDGTSFDILETDQLSRAVFVSGTYEPNTLCVLRRLIREGGEFIDVGANAGIVSLAVSTWIGTGRVFSIEPSSREYRRLVGNITRNAAVNVTPCCVAIAAQPGTVNLRIAGDAYRGLNTVGTDFPYDGVDTLRIEKVEATTLDEFVNAQHIGSPLVIKVDAEGAESAVLAGARGVLARHRPAIVLEVFSTSLAANGASPSVIEQQLRDVQYRLFAIDDVYARLRPLSNLGGIDEQNVVALPEEMDLSGWA